VGDLGRSVGDAISGAGESFGNALAGAVDGTIRSFGSIPGGPIWLVVLAVVVVGGWMLAKR
jgi:hypothetical protein